VDVEVDGDSELAAAGGLRLLAAPGHTPGSIAVFAPGSRVLLAGDTIAESDGTVLLGPFDVDPEQAWASLRRLAALDAEIAGFGHGDPVIGDARTALRGAVDPWRG
jgi:glyoxylase-like metal-dependent hydrolase (beta-lactamase superfamily II)